MKTTKLKRIIYNDLNTSIAQAARDLKVTKQHMTNVVNGRIPAGKNLAIAIEKYTGKKIKASELMQLPESR